MSAVAEEIKRIFAQDPKLKEIEEHENVGVKISLSFDGREARASHNKKIIEFGEAGKSRLKSASSKLLGEMDDEDDDGFTIDTYVGNKTTAGSIKVSDKKRVATFGKSLDKGDAWNKLINYYRELDESRILHQ